MNKIELKTVDYLWNRIGPYIMVIVVLAYVAFANRTEKNKAIEQHTRAQTEWRQESQENTKKLMSVVNNNTKALAEFKTVVQIIAR